MNLEYIYIEGIKYPLSFSLVTAEQIAKKYRDLNVLERNLKDRNYPVDKKLNMLSDIIAMMIYSGVRYCNAYHLDPYKDAPNTQGRFVYLTSEQVKVSLPLDENSIKGLTDKIQKCIRSGNVKKIGTKPFEISGHSKKKKQRS